MLFCNHFNNIEYEKELTNNNALDFDDLLVKTLELLNSDKETLEYYQNKFKYILVDEYQDTNKSQNEIVFNLSQNCQNVFRLIRKKCEKTNEYRDWKIDRLETAASAGQRAGTEAHRRSKAHAPAREKRTEND